MARSNADIRKRQIDTLKIFNDHVMELAPNKEYSIGFTAAGRTFQLDVHLSPQFPGEPPLVQLSPQLNHPWVQPGTGVIQSAPGLVNFTMHSDLGRVVDAIIREFQRTIKPASVPTTTTTNTTDTSSSGDSSSSASSSLTTTPTAVHPNTGSNMPPSLSPAAPTLHPTIALPDLSALTVDELRTLSEDDLQLADYVDEMPTMQPLNEHVELLLDEVASLGGDNLSKEVRLKELQLAKRTGQTALRDLGADYDLANQRYQRQAEQFAPAHIKQLLQIAAAGAEDECEAHVDAFLGGRLEAGVFLERYIPAKVLGTVRKAKEDRLTHQLNALERATF